MTFSYMMPDCRLYCQLAYRNNSGLRLCVRGWEERSVLEVSPEHSNSFQINTGISRSLPNPFWPVDHGIARQEENPESESNVG